MPDIQQCRRCVMDTSDPAIVFDHEGICNHCRTYDALKHKHQYHADRTAALLDRIKQRGRSSAYDCVVGISGGTDSSYLLHQLKHSGLRILAVHYDSGWNSEEAVFNIKALTESMGIDLHICTVDRNEFRALQLAYLKAGVIDLDVPTDHALHGSLYRAAAEKRIPFIITGHNMETESIMPAAWVADKLDSTNVRDIYRKHGSGLPLESFPLQTPWTKFKNYNLHKIEMVFLLNYLPYNKQEASELLTKEYNWAPVRVKHGESIWTRFYQCYILPERFGVDKRKAHFSNLVLSGVMSRKEALEALRLPIYRDDLEQDKAVILERYGITVPEFEAYMRSPIRQHTDFKTERRLKAAYSFLRGLIPKGLLHASTRH